MGRSARGPRLSRDRRRPLIPAVMGFTVEPFQFFFGLSLARRRVLVDTFGPWGHGHYFHLRLCGSLIVGLDQMFESAVLSLPSHGYLESSLTSPML